MHHVLRRTAATLAVPALSLTALGAIPSPARAATDPAPAAASAAWLAGQVPASGIIVTSGEYDGTPYSYDDYGLSVDVGFALDGAGSQAAVVGRIVDALEAKSDAYVAPGYGTLVAAGAAGKLLSFLQSVDGDPAVVADLQRDLESTVAQEGTIAGRVVDRLDPEDEFATDYASVVSQSWAVLGLEGAASSLTGLATDFLLKQQCDAGYFRQQFSARDAADQTCDGSGGAPDVDATAFALRALAPQAGDVEVDASIKAAVAWLKSNQKADGGFGADASLPGTNANSTGLAAWALGTLGETGAAEDAAAWVRAHQAANVANCVSYTAADLGAIAYDDTALASIQGGPAIDPASQGQFLLATAQALPALQFAPAGTGDPHALFAAEYVRAGGFKPVGVIDAAPGEALCAMLGEQSVLGYADRNGEAQLRVRIPATTAKSRVTVANADGTVGTVTINALGAKTLRVSVRTKVKAGKYAGVEVRGLRAGENYTYVVTFAGRKPQGFSDQADGRGVAIEQRVPRRAFGKATIVVKGAFANRKGVATFTVTR